MNIIISLDDYCHYLTHHYHYRLIINVITIITIMFIFIIYITIAYIVTRQK